MHVTDHIKRVLGERGMWGTCPPSRFQNRIWYHFGVKQEQMDDQLPNLVIVFEAFNRLHNLKVWLRFAPQRQQKQP